jgi:ferrochelatase
MALERTAVVIYNLGGPDSLEAVRPFLFNLFNDPSILRQAAPLRWLLARLISRRRAPIAREIYGRLGGRSPILPETEAQARALEAALGADETCRVFVAMRYWHPFAAECAGAVKAYDPDRIVLLPLYPQYSTTTTESFLRTWRHAVREVGLDRPTGSICCYPREAGFVDALAALIRRGIDSLRCDPAPRVLFSAHGLPRKFVTAGDPYQAQVEMTVAAVVEKLAMPGLDYAICYQSRVGPVEWLRPYTDDEIRRAGADGRALVVAPVAFVSEHSETLVELDIEYAKLARDCGVPAYHRAPTVGVQPVFIDGLARLVRHASRNSLSSGEGRRVCPAACGACPIP